MLDLGLRGMSGFEFARRLRALAGPTPVVALTGDARPETRARAASEGFAAFFVKPDGVDQLLHVLRRLLEQGGTA